MLRRVALVIPDVSEELSASFIRVTRIGELGTTLAVTSNRGTLRRNDFVFLRSVRRLLVTASVEEWCLLGCYAVKTSNLTQLVLFLVHRFLSP
jgi:hypothetical protein